MKAAAYTRYGPPDVVQIMDVEKPVPKDNEVLIKVRAASVNPADWRLMGGAPYVFRVLFRLRKPTPAKPGRLGHDVAGQVEVVGRNVTRFKPADSVFGTCRGALAEYACASESADQYRFNRLGDAVSTNPFRPIPCHQPNNQRSPNRNQHRQDIIPLA